MSSEQARARAAGAFARNAWGMTMHLFDLPFKFALPFLLWIGFYLSDLGSAFGLKAEEPPSGPARSRR